MQTYVSLLRGINVGGRTVKMADLKACYEKAGFANVTTLLQSGNVVFTSPLTDPEAIRSKLEAAVSSSFNYPAKIMVLRQNELASLIDAYPFDSSEDHYQHYLIFVRAGLAEKLANQATGADPTLEQIAPGNNVVYWKVEKGMTLKTPFAKVLTKPEFKDFHTTRNLKTVTKLAAQI